MNNHSHKDTVTDPSVGHTEKLQSLLRNFKIGDSNAINAIIEHACERLQKQTQRMLRSYSRVKRWELTDDVLQNSLIRLHRSLLEIKPESPRQFYGLAATQIRRELIDLARRHYSQTGIGQNHQTDNPNLPARIDVDSTSGIEPMTLEDWSIFHEVVESLPNEQKEVFELLWYHGFSQQEASTVLDVSIRTIKRRWQEARLTIHAAMDGEQPR